MFQYSNERAEERMDFRAVWSKKKSSLKVSGIGCNKNVYMVQKMQEDNDSN